jgi:hypothetical protein
MAEHHAPALDPHDPRLVEVNDPADIFPELDGTAVGDLLRWHNLPQSRGSMPLSSARARLLVSMCMDHRADLIIPNEFAYILRSAGGTLRDSDFEVQYAVAVGGVTEIALLAHTDCGMVGVSGKRAKFVDGLVTSPTTSSTASRPSTSSTMWLPLWSTSAAGSRRCSPACAPRRSSTGWRTTSSFRFAPPLDR